MKVTTEEQERVMEYLTEYGVGYAWDGSDWSIWCIYDKDRGHQWYYTEIDDDDDDDDDPTILSLSDARIPWDHILDDIVVGDASVYRNTLGDEA